MENINVSGHEATDSTLIIMALITTVLGPISTAIVGWMLHKEGKRRHAEVAETAKETKAEVSSTKHDVEAVKRSVVNDHEHDLRSDVDKVMAAQKVQEGKIDLLAMEFKNTTDELAKHRIVDSEIVKRLSSLDAKIDTQTNNLNKHISWCETEMSRLWHENSERKQEIANATKESKSA